MTLPALDGIPEKLQALLTYDASSPLIFSSGLFLFLFAGFMLVYSMFRRAPMARIVYVILFSLYFYYKSSGIYFLLLIFAATSDYWIAKGIHAARSTRAKRWLVVLSVAVNLGMLAYFKYTNFLIDIANQMFGQGFMQFQNIFLPVGISFFVFQSMSYTIDIYRGQLKPLDNWCDYLFYLSFFPQLVAGPIVRARDFIPQIRQNPIVVTREMFGTGVFLILTGLFKKAIISDYISLNFVDRIFDEPLLYSGFECLAGIYGYALQIYCDFSGYSDMAIGIALLLGFRFPKNFDAPYKSATITEFWRRWHISLSTWLRDYLYISLGGNRKGKLRTYGNLLITMLLGGLWHGAAVRFILWGALHGAALALQREYEFQAAACMDKFMHKTDLRVTKMMLKGYEQDKAANAPQPKYRCLVWACPAHYYTNFTYWTQHCWGVTCVNDMEAMLSYLPITIGDKEQALADLARCYEKMMMRSHTNGGYVNLLDECWKMCEKFHTNIVIMYDHVSCKNVGGLHGLFEDQARERGIHLIWIPHDVMDPRTVSRREMREAFSQYMVTVLNEKPLDPTLLDYEDALSW